VVRAGTMTRGQRMVNLHGDAFVLTVRTERGTHGKRRYTWRFRLPAVHYDRTFAHLPGVLRLLP